MLRVLRRILNGAKRQEKSTDLSSSDGPQLMRSGNIEHIREILDGCGDVRFRPLSRSDSRWWLVYVPGVVDITRLEQSVLAPLQQAEEDGISLQEALPAANVRTVRSVDDLVNSVLVGHVAIVADHLIEAYLVPLETRPSRSVDIPQVERVVTGPQEAFVEDLNTNTALIRHYLPTPRLKMEVFTAGRLSHTKIHMFYIDDLCPPEQRDEVRRLLRGLSDMAMTGNQMVQNRLTKRRVPLVPEILQTERPDRVIAALAEGRLAIAVGGSGNLLILPVHFVDFIKSPEDYYLTPITAMLSRLIRVVGIFEATTLTAIYVSLVVFHYEVIPFSLLTPLAQSIIQLPFSPVIEALIMEAATDVLREASTRLPGPLGPIIGVVGALIIGQAAIQAKLVSPVLVIIIALSMIASYTIADYSFSSSLRVWRYPLILAAGTL